MRRKRAIVIAAAAAFSLALVVICTLGLVSGFQTTSRLAFLAIGFFTILITCIGFGLFALVGGDADHLRRMTWIRDGRCPGYGSLPRSDASTAPAGQEGLCDSCGAALSYPPLVYPTTGPCGACGYPITGVQGAYCPECGAPLHELHLRHQRAGHAAGTPSQKPSTLRT